jgi:hypothetical protein
MRKTMPLPCNYAARIVSAVLFCVGCSGAALGVDHVSLKRDGELIRIEGRVLVTALDGGMQVQGRDGIIWSVQPDELVEHRADEAPFEPLSAEELTQELLNELPEGFEVRPTAHYLICYNTSRAYAQWCGSLFERLYMAFTNFWSRKGFELSEPEFPLVAIVFADKASYVEFSRPEVGDAVEAIIGHYSLRTNRMVMYDLTEFESRNRYNTGRSTLAQINQFLRRPDARRTVATIVHEATHQIAYNCGLHTRYSDCPRWFSEGIAVYFETPDLGSSKGWRSIGQINRPRLAQFQKYLRRRPPDSLVSLLRDDERFRDTKGGADAYAETWALTYFLIRRHPDRYVQYLKLLSEKKPLLWDDPETRLDEFREVFGDIERLDAEFVRSTAKLR